MRWPVAKAALLCPGCHRTDYAPHTADTAHLVSSPSAETDRLIKAEAAVERVRKHVDGFVDRAPDLVNNTDRLWIIAIRKQLDGDEVNRG